MTRLVTHTRPGDNVGVGASMPDIQKKILDKLLEICSQGTGTYQVRDIKQAIESNSREIYGTRIYIAKTHIADYIETNYPHLVTDTGLVKGRLYSPYIRIRRNSRQSVRKDLFEYWYKFDGQLEYVKDLDVGIPLYRVVSFNPIGKLG